MLIEYIAAEEKLEYTDEEKADVLLAAGMHCLGCPASQAETIEEACEVHGIDVEELIKELNA